MSIEKDYEKLRLHEDDEPEQFEALIEDMRGKYREELADGPATFEPDPRLRAILMEIVFFDQRKKLRRPS